MLNYEGLNILKLHFVFLTSANFALLSNIVYDLAADMVFSNTLYNFEETQNYKETSEDAIVRFNSKIPNSFNHEKKVTYTKYCMKTMVFLINFNSLSLTSVKKEVKGKTQNGVQDGSRTNLT